MKSPSSSVRKVVVVLAILALWNALGLVALAIWRLFTPTSLIADQGLLIAVFVLIGASASVFAWTQELSGLSWRWVMVVLSGATAFLFFLQFSLGIPLNIDRSRSFHVLHWVSQLQPTDQESLLSTVDERLGQGDSNGITLRVSEHVQRGLIVEKNGEYELSGPGHLIVNVSDLLAEVFSLKGWQANALVGQDVL